MLNNFNDAIMIILCFTFILLGILISTIIDKSLPTTTTNNSLYKVGIISMLAIIIHNIPEGIATFISTTKSTSLGISLTIAIALHNIPDGLINYVTYYNNKTIIKIHFYNIIY